MYCYPNDLLYSVVLEETNGRAYPSTKKSEKQLGSGSGENNRHIPQIVLLTKIDGLKLRHEVNPKNVENCPMIDSSSSSTLISIRLQSNLNSHSGALLHIPE